MIEQEGVVIAVRGDFAEVEGRRQSACSGCAANGACGTSLLERVFGRRQPLITARNPIGARPGETVVLGVPESALLEAAFAAYLVPLFAMIAGALVGDYVASVASVDPHRGIAVLGGAAGLALGIAWLARFSRARGRDTRYQAVILRRGDRLQVDVTLFPLDSRARNGSGEF